MLTAVASTSPLAVASFEAGSRMRATIMASTWFLLDEGFGSISASRPSFFSVPSTAAT
ncbi:MAG: hypothetical protein J4G15_09340 [Alphaproteobacteria bacterium]|nr:hypothetical protein [Alphaproteobacteria bacterium]